MSAACALGSFGACGGTQPTEEVPAPQERTVAAAQAVVAQTYAWHIASGSTHAGPTPTRRNFLTLYNPAPIDTTATVVLWKDNGDSVTAAAAKPIPKRSVITIALHSIPEAATAKFGIDVTSPSPDLVPALETYVKGYPDVGPAPSPTGDDGDIIPATPYQNLSTSTVLPLGWFTKDNPGNRWDGRLALYNPSATTTANVTVVATLANGAPGSWTKTVTLTPHKRDEIVMDNDAAFATAAQKDHILKVSSNIPVLAEMEHLYTRFGATGDGDGQAVQVGVPAATAASTTHYDIGYNHYDPSNACAAGADCQIWLTNINIYNPGAIQATVAITYNYKKSSIAQSNPEGNDKVTVSYTVPPGQRIAIATKDHNLLDDADFSWSATSTQKVIMTSALHFHRRGVPATPAGAGGMIRLAATKGEMLQVLSHGYLSPAASNYLFVNNTLDIPTDVYVDYYRHDGWFLGESKLTLGGISAGNASRGSVNVGAALPGVTKKGYVAIVRSGVPVVARLGVYWTEGADEATPHFDRTAGGFIENGTRIAPAPANNGMGLYSQPPAGEPLPGQPPPDPLKVQQHIEDTVQFDGQVVQMNLNWGGVAPLDDPFKNLPNTSYCQAGADAIWMAKNIEEDGVTDPNVLKAIFRWKRSGFHAYVDAILRAKRQPIFMISYFPGYVRDGGKDSNLLAAGLKTNDPEKICAFKSFIKIAMNKYPGAIWMLQEELDLRWNASADTGGYGDSNGYSTNILSCNDNDLTLAMAYKEALKIMADQRDVMKQQGDSKVRVFISPMAHPPGELEFTTSSGENSGNLWDRCFLKKLGKAGAFQHADGWSYNFYQEDDFWWAQEYPNLTGQRITRKARALYDQLPCPVGEIPCASKQLPVLVNTGAAHFASAYRTKPDLTMEEIDTPFENLTPQNGGYIAEQLAVLLWVPHWPAETRVPIKLMTSFIHKPFEMTRSFSFCRSTANTSQWSLPVGCTPSADGSTLCQCAASGCTAANKNCCAVGQTCEVKQSGRGNLFGLYGKDEWRRSPRFRMAQKVAEFIDSPPTKADPVDWLGNDQVVTGYPFRGLRFEVPGRKPQIVWDQSSNHARDTTGKRPNVKICYDSKGPDFVVGKDCVLINGVADP